MKKILFLSFLLFFSALTAAHAEEQKYKFRGFFKGYFQGQKFTYGSENSTISQSDLVVSTRPSILWRFSQSVNMELAYKLSINYIKQFSFFPNSFSDIIGPKYRIYDLNHVFLTDRFVSNQSKSLSFTQNLDRFLLNFSFTYFDLHLGRQPISFGHAKVINPTDIIRSFHFIAIDTENREGVDSARVKIPWGDMGEIDVGFITGEKAKRKNNTFFINLKHSNNNWDSSLIVTNFRKHSMLGINLTSDFFDAGVWLEIAFFDLQQSNRVYSKDCLQTTVGMEYTFNGNLMAFLELHSNGAGTKNFHQYISAQQKTSYTEGITSLLGKHFVIPGVIYQITPLTNIFSSVIYNLNDNSGLITNKLEWNFTEDSYLDFGISLGLGNKNQSEFGTYSDKFYLLFRNYF